MEYDISAGFDKEITLFEDEISVPLGNAGSAKGRVTFSGFENISMDQFNGSDLLKLTDEIKNEFFGQLKHTPQENTIRFRGLPIKANAAIKYEMPFYEALTAGLTGNWWKNGPVNYWETRFALALNPLEWLDVTANIGKGAFGSVWGIAGSIKVLSFRLNAGLENGLGGTIPYTSTPLKANLKVLTFGVTYDL